MNLGGYYLNDFMQVLQYLKIILLMHFCHKYSLAKSPDPPLTWSYIDHNTPSHRQSK